MKQDVVSHTAIRTVRHGQPVGESHFYTSVESLETPVICSNCDAVFQNGRWQWSAAPIDSVFSHCPACARVKQKAPAGYVNLMGHFAHDHRNEMLSLIHHIEKREKASHPLKRIMWIEYQESGITVTTTDIQLTRDIADALLRAYKGDLDYHLNDTEERLYVRWFR